MKKTQKIIAVLIVLAMVMGAGNLVLLVSADYENTYTNTGNQRADIIGVAKTQIGYTEGSNNNNK